MVDWTDVAMVYCKYRITIGAVIMLFLALGFFLDLGTSTSEDPPTFVKGTHLGGGVVTYEVDGRMYSLSQEDVRVKYPFVIYNPADPADARARARSPAVRTDGFRNFFTTVACLMVLCAVLALYFRTNPVLCGATIAGNALTLLSPTPSMFITRF